MSFFFFLLKKNHSILGNDNKYNPRLTDLGTYKINNKSELK